MNKRRRYGTGKEEKRRNFFTNYTGMPLGNECKKAYPEPQRKYDQRCSTCQGSGKIHSLSGFGPCPRCCDNENL